MNTQTWPGTEAESFALLEALNHNCQCQFDGDGARTSTCPAHGLLTAGEDTLKRLLWGRSMRARLLAEEDSTAAPEPAP